jgi:hypothetical protein
MATDQSPDDYDAAENRRHRAEQGKSGDRHLARFLGQVGTIHRRRAH